MAQPRNLLSFFRPSHVPFSPVKLFATLVHKKSKDTGQKLPKKQIIFYQDTQLIVIRSPDAKDQSFLRKKYNFHPIHLDDITSPIQRPKIDLEDDYIFAVLHFPQYNPQTKKIESREIDIFLTPNNVILVFEEEYQPLEDIISVLAKKKEYRRRYFQHGTGVLFYHLIDETIDTIFPIIDKFEKVIELIDQQVFSKDPKNVTEQLSFLKRNVIFFQTLIKPELNSFAQIETTSHHLVDKEMKTYFSNITDHLKKIWDRLEDIHELTDNLSDAFESYITFKTNETIKILTVFSVILLPLTLLTGIYGMNLTFLPFSQHPNALVYISLSMIGLVISMLAVFRLKHWI